MCKVLFRVQDEVLRSAVRDEAAERQALDVGRGPHAARPGARAHAARRHAGAARPTRTRRKKQRATLQRVSFLTDFQKEDVSIQN